MTSEEAYAWLLAKRAACAMAVSLVPMAQVTDWQKDEATGWLSHRSGGFFRVLGIQVTHASREVQSWNQPILEQRLPGLLGILVSGNDECLLQAKAEPGNIDLVQFAPTVQSTVANLKQLHGGRRPLFAEYFETAGPDRETLFSVLQSESGGRFYGKANRNMMVRVSGKIEIPDDFIWIPLCEVKRLLRMDNVVNAYARSILSCV
jgi:oxidase EvaA